MCAIPTWNIEPLSAKNADILVVNSHLVATNMLVETRFLVEKLSASLANKLLIDVKLAMLVQRLLLAECLPANLTLEWAFMCSRFL